MPVRFPLFSFCPDNNKPEQASPFELVKHRVPIPRIDNARSFQELWWYAERTQKILHDESIEWVVSMEIDGSTVSTVYENGILVRGLTRGDGLFGDDITIALNVPLRLKGNNIPPVLEVRGEIYITREDFLALNEEQRAIRLPPWPNARNFAAGTIRRLVPPFSAERHMRLSCDDVGYREGLKASTHWEVLDELRCFGLPVTPSIERFSDFADAMRHCNGIIGRLPEFPFEVARIVIRVNSLAQCKRLGTTSMIPQWLIAYAGDPFPLVSRPGLSPG